MKSLKVSFADFESDKLDQESLKNIVGSGTADSHTSGDVGNCDNDTGGSDDFVSSSRVNLDGSTDKKWDHID